MSEDPTERESTATGKIDDANTAPSVDPNSLRGTIGGGMDQFTQVINNNLIAARYGIFAGVTLLTVYGLSQTPLFFRYRTVAHVPASSFIGRQRLYGRIVGVTTQAAKQQSISGTSDGVGETIVIHVRHLSPIGQILPKSWFDFLVKFSPHTSKRLGSQSESTGNSRDLLNIKLAGIHPPPVSSLRYKPEEQLQQLARERTLVSCQLLAREVETSQNILSSNDHWKRPISDVMPEFSKESDEYKKNVQMKPNAIDDDSSVQEIAICRVSYRSKFFQFFPTDMAESLIESGNASVSNSILGRDSSENASTKIVDTSQRLQDLRNDVGYLDRLARTELKAAGKAIGMWSLPEVREQKKEVVEEVEFQSKANVFQKVWRWIRS